MRHTSFHFLFCFFLAAPLLAWADVRVVDDTGATIALPAPAQRIVTLAPHTTELLFAADAGKRIVATVDYSDYPEAARAIPRVGSSSGIDIERIVALKPDLVVAWSSGNPRRAIEQLRQLGLPVYLTEPRHLADIARTMENLGRLAGTESVAQEEAERFRAHSAALVAKYAKRKPLRVFYQVVDPLLITVNGKHLIDEILRLCGGQNIFAALPVIAPVIGEEAVLKENPDVILAGGTEEGWRPWQARWRERTSLTATQRGTIYFVSADVIHRHSPRILDGAEQICSVLDNARTKLAAPSAK